MKQFVNVLHSEPAIWSVGIVAALTGHMAGGAFFDAATGHKYADVHWWILLYVALTLCFYLLYENPVPHRLPAGVKVTILLTGALPWLFGAAAIIAAFGVATGFHRLTLGEAIASRVLVSYVAAFGVSVALLYSRRRDVLIIHTRYIREEPRSRSRTRRHIIALLSQVTGRSAPLDGLPEGLHWSPHPVLADDFKTLSQRRAGGAPDWPWEVLLRGLPTASSGAELILICSRESIPQVPLFMRVLGRYDEFRALTVSVWALRSGTLTLLDANDANALVASDGLAFNDINDVSGALTDLLKYLRFIKGVSDRDMVIDFTGGQKPTSLVAGAITFRSRSVAQYVDTGTLEVKTFDIGMNPEVRGV